MPGQSLIGRGILTSDVTVPGEPWVDEHASTEAPEALFALQPPRDVVRKPRPLRRWTRARTPDEDQRLLAVGLDQAGQVGLLDRGVLVVLQASTCPGARRRWMAGPAASPARRGQSPRRRRRSGLGCPCRRAAPRQPTVPVRCRRGSRPTEAVWLECEWAKAARLAGVVQWQNISFPS